MVKINIPPEWGIEPVPQEAKQLRFLDFFVLWSSLGVGLLVMLAGSLLVPALGLAEALVAIVLGTLVGNLFLSLAGNLGGRYGVPTMVSLRPSFGIRGSYIPTFLNVVQLVGWTAFEVLVMGQAADVVVKSFTGYSNIFVWMVVFALVVAAMALGGPLVIVRQWLERFAIWIVYFTAAWITVYLFASHDVFALLLKPGRGGLSFPAALDLVIAMPISWMPLVSDYNRFAKNAKGSFGGTYAGYFVANVWFYSLGALLLLTSRMESLDVVGAISLLGFGSTALLLILVDETDNGFADVYSAAVSAQNFATRAKLRYLILVVSGAGLLVALYIQGFHPEAQYSAYESFLFLIGSFFLPIFGVAIVDHYLLKKAYDVNGMYGGRAYWYNGGVNWRAVVGLIAGIAVYQYVVNFASELGASLPSLLSAALVYLFLSKVK